LLALAWIAPEVAAAAATAQALPCRRRSAAKPERSTSASWVVSCGTTPCEAGGSGVTCKQARRAKRTSTRLASLPRVAITRGDATRNVALDPKSSSRASLRSALVLERCRRRSAAKTATSPTTTQCPEDSLRRAQPEGAAAAATAKVTCGTTACEAGGSGLTSKHPRRAKQASLIRRMTRASPSPQMMPRESSSELGVDQRINHSCANGNGHVRSIASSC